MSMITDRIRRHEVLLPINPINYNFRENKNSQVMKGRGNLYLNVALHTVTMVIETKIEERNLLPNRDWKIKNSEKKEEEKLYHNLKVYANFRG